MLSLHEVFRLHGHVVTQIVKAELVVRTKGDVCLICLASLFAVRTMLVDAVHAQSVEHIERSHPFGVTLGQIVVDRYDMHAVASQCVEEYRAGSHEGLTFTRCHLGNLALMEHGTADELHVIVYHLPLRIVAACGPMVVVYGLIAVDGDEVV